MQGKHVLSEINSHVQNTHGLPPLSVYSPFLSTSIDAGVCQNFKIHMPKTLQIMGDPIQWEVQLPIVGVKIDNDEINFGLFSIKKSTMEILTAKHNLTVHESMWSNIALAVKVTGTQIALEDLCDSCPRRSTPYTRPIAIDGQVMEMTTFQRKACICLKLENLTGRTDAVGVALHLLEDVLSLIRLYIQISSKGSLPAHAAISLNRLPNYSNVAAFSDSKVAYTENLVLKTRKYGVPIYQAEVNEWISELGFGDLVDILYRSHTGEPVAEIEEILGASFIQFGSMLEEANLRDCFLRGATAIEAITNAAPGSGGIALKFREFGATLASIASNPNLVLSSTPYADAQMKNVWASDRDELKLIYKERCHISHGSRRLDENNENILFQHQMFFAKIAYGALLLFMNTEKTKQKFYLKLQSLKNDHFR